MCFATWGVCLVLVWTRAWGIFGAALGRVRSWLWGMLSVRLLVSRTRRQTGMRDGCMVGS